MDKCEEGRRREREQGTNGKRWQVTERAKRQCDSQNHSARPTPSTRSRNNPRLEAHLHTASSPFPPSTTPLGIRHPHTKHCSDDILTGEGIRTNFWHFLPRFSLTLTYSAARSFHQIKDTGATMVTGTPAGIWKWKSFLAIHIYNMSASPARYTILVNKM